MGDKIDEMYDSIKRVLNKLGLDSTNVGYSTSRNSFSNSIVLRTYWAIDTVEIKLCLNKLNKPKLIDVICSKQLDALYGLQNDINKQIIDLGGTVNL